MESGAIVKCLPLSARRGRDTERGLPQLLESLSKDGVAPSTILVASSYPYVAPQYHHGPHENNSRPHRPRPVAATSTQPPTPVIPLKIAIVHIPHTVIPAKERHPVPRYGAGIHPRAPAIRSTVTTGRPHFRLFIAQVVQGGTPAWDIFRERTSLPYLSFRMQRSEVRNPKSSPSRTHHLCNTLHFLPISAPSAPSAVNPPLAPTYFLNNV